MKKITIINKEFMQFLKNRDSAYVDYLTQLPNRRAMYDYYNKMKKDSYVSVFFIDIDNFKMFNDVYGHSVGDELLITLAQYFRQSFPTSGMFRIGGDEFVAITEGRKIEAEAIALATNLLEGIKNLKFREDVRSQLTLSVGIIANQNVSVNLDDILEKCDNAMYRAKQKGKNSCVVFNSLEEEMKKTSEIEEETEAAYSHNEFVPYFLPKIDIFSKTVYGAELLVRWVHWLDGVRTPDAFIPVFEKNGSVSKLDFYMFETACKMKEDWKNTPLEKIVLAVNFSPVSFYISDFKDRLVKIADRYAIPHEQLEIEVPGKTYTDCTDRVKDLLKSLKEAGFLVTLDNFGGTYSSLAAIKDLPIDTVKFERNFIRSTTSDKRGKKILRNLFTLCKDLKVDIMAIGVEEEEQLETLVSCGCYKAQGYYYLEPATEDEFIKYALSNSENYAKPVKFSFNNTLTSDDEKYTAEILNPTDDGRFEFAEGPKEGLGAIRFPGGHRNEDNILKIPNEVLRTESWTICFWMNAEAINRWTVILYIKYELGFVSFAPNSSDVNCCFRIRDSREESEWYDTKYDILPLNTWEHVTISYDSEKEETNLYLNGKKVAGLKKVPAQRFVYNFWLGGDPYQQSFRGRLSEFTIYPEEKTPEEIEKIYKSF
ncbi:MAG: EAL domain-containing protein [Lachnospiraceae bacterium]|nr:EAL domain-containing protein [Lachnospiraceae bacterium]